MARNVAALAVPVAMGVGGVLDYVAGRTPRAPRWLRELGLEWLFRLLIQPWRWRRQLALPHFALLALWETPRQRRAWRGRGATHGSAAAGALWARHSGPNSHRDARGENA